jgi:hypothetical protein
MPWYRGNLHCHSTNSDGDSSPAFLAKFYKDAGFDFLCITDHNHLTLPEECGPPDPKFLLLPSSEYTGLSEGYAHVNGLGLTKPFQLSEVKGMSKALQEGVDLAKAQGAVSMINHPNWHWSFGAKEMAQVKGADMFEVYGGAYTCNNEGAPGYPSTDEIWDELLSQGIRIFGAGSDDCHRHQPPLDPFIEPPASAWTVVQAESLTVENIVAALKAGRFYAATRIELESIESDAKELRLKIKQWDQLKYYTRFIGKGGRILAEVNGLEPSYKFKGDEGYVRAKVFCSDRHMAWTQPVFL